jgi:hypothetical protein
MSVRDKNPTAFYGKLKREQRIVKTFKSFIYFLICRNLCADCYIFKDLFEVKVVEYLLGKELK